jgi:chorismate mutase
MQRAKEANMTIRGVRGATVTEHDQPESILSATRQLLQALVAANSGLEPVDIASIFFTVSPDLHSIHPALAARQLGWTQVPLMCAVEIDVPDGLPGCIRVLLHWNTEKPQHEIQHVYLGKAAALRPDLSIKTAG